MPNFANDSADKGSDNENVEERSSCDEDENSLESSLSDDDNSISAAEVPDNFIFPCCMVFALLGPFVDPKDGLLTLEVGDALKNTAAMRRSAKQKAQLAEKSEDRNSDTQHLQGFSAYQKISIETSIAQENI